MPVGIRPMVMLACRCLEEARLALCAVISVVAVARYCAAVGMASILLQHERPLWLHGPIGLFADDAHRLSLQCAVMSCFCCACFQSWSCAVPAVTRCVDSSFFCA